MSGHYYLLKFLILKILIPTVIINLEVLYYEMLKMDVRLLGTSKRQT